LRVWEPQGHLSNNNSAFLCGTDPLWPQGGWIGYSSFLILKGKIYGCSLSSPERFLDRRYPSIIHGVGMHGETPLVAHHMDFDAFSRDGILEPGMTVSVESYIGEVDGAEGVKLEEEVLVTDTGVAMISRYPFDEGCHFPDTHRRHDSVPTIRLCKPYYK